jgi:DNA polymerase-1
VKTGALYGFFKDIVTLQEEFHTDKFVFCFDHGKSFRQDACPSYKINRRAMERTDDVIREARRELRLQTELLKLDYLRRLGYSNIFYQDGYEADDVIAQVCFDTVYPKDHVDAVIVSADKDLFQLLREDKVCMYMPRDRVTVTEESFRKNYRIAPSEWPLVKAIGGCSSDNVRGVKGVGEITALKWVREEVKGIVGDRVRAIQESDELIQSNLELVTLPYNVVPPLRRFPVKKDHTHPRKWQEVMSELGIKSLKAPL